MKLLPTLAVLALVSAFATPAEAGGHNNNNNKQAMERAKREKAQREKERAERKKVNEEVKDYLEDVDKNKNNSVSKDEFIAAAAQSEKADAEKDFLEYDINKDRNLNKSEIKKMLGLD